MPTNKSTVLKIHDCVFVSSLCIVFVFDSFRVCSCASIECREKSNFQHPTDYPKRFDWIMSLLSVSNETETPLGRRFHCNKSTTKYQDEITTSTHECARAHADKSNTSSGGFARMSNKLTKSHKEKKRTKLDKQKNSKHRSKMEKLCVICALLWGFYVHSLAFIDRRQPEKCNQDYVRLANYEVFCLLMPDIHCSHRTNKSIVV